MEKRYVVPPEMLRAAGEWAKENETFGIVAIQGTLEAAIRWLDEQVPTDEQAQQIWKEDVTEYYEHYQPVQQIIAAWIRRMFAAPEPEVPECLEGMFFSEADIEIHLRKANAKQLSEHLNSYILQAYRMGESK